LAGEKEAGLTHASYIQFYYNVIRLGSSAQPDRPHLLSLLPRPNLTPFPCRLGVGSSRTTRSTSRGPTGGQVPSIRGFATMRAPDASCSVTVATSLGSTEHRGSDSHLPETLMPEPAIPHSAGIAHRVGGRSPANCIARSCAQKAPPKSKAFSRTVRCTASINPFRHSPDAQPPPPHCRRVDQQPP